MIFNPIAFSNHCWATQEFIVMKQCISLFELTVNQKWDSMVPIVAQQWNLGTF
jgi:hypothetical protein